MFLSYEKECTIKKEKKKKKGKVLHEKILAFIQSALFFLWCTGCLICDLVLDFVYGI